MEAELIIEKNGREIRSSVAVDASRGAVRISTTLGGVTRTSVLAIHPRPDYSQEQLEFDVDQARHRAADELLGAHEVAELLGAQTASGAGSPRRVTGPTATKPGKGA